MIATIPDTIAATSAGPMKVLISTPYPTSLNTRFRSYLFNQKY